jgi:nucleotide-binding universal stress UspA family protein
MTVVAILLAVALVAVSAIALREQFRRNPKLPTAAPARVIFPFTGSALSERALDAALRLARIDGATLVPVFLAQVPMHLPLDAALPRQCDGALPLLEAVEQRAARAGVAVDSRIERGRSFRHAIRGLVEHESFDTFVVTAGNATTPGLLPEEVSWVLEHVPGEIIVIRPGSARTLTAPLRGTRSRRSAHRRGHRRVARVAP